MVKRRASKKPAPVPRDGLTGKQRMFVDAYLGEAKGNATEAARIAGYAHPNSQAWEALKHPAVQAQLQKRFDATAMSASEVISRLSEEAAADISDFFDLEGPLPELNLKKALDAGRTHLLKSISLTRHGYKIELHDAQAAKALLGRFHGLFVDRHKHEFSDLSDEELIARAAGLVGGDGQAGTDT